MAEQLVGVVLAGGRGTRLDPITRVLNKHLLPIYDAPMIAYPVGSRVDAGIEDIVIVTNGDDIEDFQRVLGDGAAFGLRSLCYAEQTRAGGIADALLSAEDLASGQPVCVILGDNVLGGSLASAAQRFATDPTGALLMLAQVEDPRGLGVVRFESQPGAGEPLPKVIEIVEKPDDPPSHYAVTGVYMYGSDVFDVCRSITPSARGELEITAVNNAYLERDAARFELLDGWWADAGTFEGLHEASRLVAQARAGGAGADASGSQLGLSPGAP